MICQCRSISCNRCTPWCEMKIMEEPVIWGGWGYVGTPCTCPSLLLWTLNCSTKIKPLFLTKWWGRYILRKVISCSNVAKLCRLFNCRPGEVLGHLDFASFPETKLLAFLVSVFWKGHRLTEEGTQARGAEMSTSCKEPASEHFLEPHWTWALVFLSGNPTHASQE